MIKDVLVIFLVIEIKKNELLSYYMNIKIGGFVDYVVFLKLISEMKVLIMFVNE